MSSPAAKWKAAERARHKEAGRVPVTVYIYPEAREKLHRYVKRLNERTKGAEPANVCYGAEPRPNLPTAR